MDSPAKAAHGMQDVTVPRPQQPGEAPLEQRHARLQAYHAAEFQALGLDAPRIRYAPSDDVQTEFEIHLLREGDGITYLYNNALFRIEAGHRRYAAAHLNWFSQTNPSVQQISCDLSDGNWPGFARFTFSTCFAGKVLVPDYHFFQHRGYAKAQNLALQAPRWDARREDICWRGHNNNIGLFSTDLEDIDNPWLMPRVRLAMKAREIKGLDARFVAGPSQRQQAQCAAAGLMAPYRPWEDWAGDKYAIDIDGFTNAWSNFMQRLKLGCCVLKVDSPHGYRQWYYDRLVAFETHVPVKSDLSDLAEKIDWVRSHDREARDIAANGQALAHAMTFEAETATATRTIAENWR